MKHLKGFLLPVLVAVYPVIFLYSQNAAVLQPGSLALPLAAALLVAGVAYALFFFSRRRQVSASLSAAIFVVFFCSYGAIYRWLGDLVRFPLNHAILLPFTVLIACILGYLISRSKPETAAGIQKILLLIALALVCDNIISAVPTEIRKARLRQPRKPAGTPAAGITAAKKYPDIYYIVLDEYAGFDAIRGYWHENYVDEFEAFLKASGFFVAGKSHSKSTSTMIELDSRLNRKYPTPADSMVLTEDITANRVLKTVKSYGYTSVVISAGFPPSDSDYNFSCSAAGFAGFGAGEYRQFLLESSMLAAFPRIFRASNAEPVRQRDAVLYCFHKTADLAGIPSPKFVFTYIPFPHMPFIVDQNGRLIDQKYQHNWNYYLGQHRFATQQAMDLIAGLLEDADPETPPVIVIQSDHGARNVKLPSADSVILEDYPREYQTLILNALYLPGYDYAKLAGDLSPIRAIDIIFWFYLEAT